MTKNQTFSLMAFAVILALFGFQNCSKVGVTDGASTNNNKVSGQGVVSEDPPTLPSPAPTASPTPDPVPVAHADDDDDKKHDDGKKCDDDKKHDQAMNDDKKKEDDDSDELADISESDAVALCLGDKANSKLEHFKSAASVSGPEVTHLRGATLIESDNLTLVEDIRGLLVIKGKSGAASAKLIHNTRGAMVVCGLSVDKIDDSRGLVVLVNSNVKSINDHRGAIMLMNSKVDSTSDIRGVIKEIKK